MPQHRLSVVGLAVEVVDVPSGPEIVEGGRVVVVPTADDPIGPREIGASILPKQGRGGAILPPPPAYPIRTRHEMTLRVTEGGTTLVPSLRLPSPFPPPNGTRTATYAKSEQTTPGEPTKIHVRLPFTGDVSELVGREVLQRHAAFFMHHAAASVTSERST